MAIGLLIEGPNPPLVTTPTVLSSASTNTAPSRTGARPSINRPTRLRSEPFSIDANMLSVPKKPPAFAPSGRRDLLILHNNDASIGLVSVFISWPYKQRPASKRKESRAPKPMASTQSKLSNKRATASACSLGIEISNPSSPV